MSVRSHGGGAALGTFSRLVACVSTLFSSMADRRVTELGGRRMAVVVQHHHLQHAASAPAAADETRTRRSPRMWNGTVRDNLLPHGLGQNKTLTQEVEWLNKTMLDMPNNTMLERLVAQEVVKLTSKNPTVGNKTMLERQNKTVMDQLRTKIDSRLGMQRYKAAMRLGFVGKQPGGARALLPVVPGLVLALVQDTDKRVRLRAVTALGRAGPEAPDRTATIVLPLLRAAAEDKELAVRTKALEVLSFLLGHENAEQAVPVALRAAEDDEWRVRAAAVDVLEALAKLAGPGAAGQFAPVMLRLAANDTEGHVRAPAMDVLPMLGPEAAERATSVALRALSDDKDETVRQVAQRVLVKLGGVEAARRTMRTLSEILGERPDCGDCWTPDKVTRLTNAFRTLGRLANLFWTLEPAALKQLVPTLVLTLNKTMPYLSLSMLSRAGHGPAMECAVRVSRALAKVASVAEIDALNLLNDAEKEPDVDDHYKLNIRRCRGVVQDALEAKCLGSFLKKSGSVTKADNLTIEIPFGVMLASDANTNSTQAYKCPNPYSCAMPRYQRMRPALTSSTTVEEGGCPFLLVTPLVTSHGAPDEDSSVCAAGIDPASLGCTKCAAGLGRRNTDPFSCERCAKLDSAVRWWATWLTQPLLIFLLSLRSAENAAASRRMSEALANDVVKIILAYLSSISVVVSSVTSTAAYRELNAEDRAREMLRLTRQTAQPGDVTYSSSSDCLLMNGEGAASVDQLLAFSLQKPACVLAIVALLIAIRACGRAAFSGGIFDLKELRAEILNSLVTCSLVAGNQFLPGVASACMRALPCFHMQAAVDERGPLQFMAYDPDTKCRENVQLLATCGPVLAFAFVAGPAYWLTLLRRQQGAQQRGPLRFLTGSYRKGFHWWEAGRLSKTMLIACVVTASPRSYCPLQQLQLCLLVTVAYGFWHCFNCPYNHLLVNVAEAGSLFTLSVGMMLAGLLAGAEWSLTPDFRSMIVTGIAAVLLFYLFGLACLWVKVKFFWHEAEANDGETNDGAAGEGAPADGVS